MIRSLALLSSLPLITSLLYDVTEQCQSPPPACPLGCAPWSNLSSSHNTTPQPSVDALWASSTAQTAAGSSCAMPALFAGQPEQPDAGFDFVYGPMCYCAGTSSHPTSSFGYCGPPVHPTPQQVTLQLGANAEERVVSFVTFDGGFQGVPLVELCVSGSSCRNITGTTKVAAAPQTNGTRLYSFHTVVLPAGLPPAANCTYRVAGGVGVWRGDFFFVTPPLDAPTRVTIVGDMGVYSYAVFSNLLDDINGPTPPSWFVCLGDHGYNLAMGGGARGDGYFVVAQPVFSRVPVVTLIGNHELEGSPFGAYCPTADNCEARYLDQLGQATNRTGSFSGSNSSLYYSVDLGLVHLVVLNYLYWLGLAPRSTVPAQLAWLAADLAAAAAPAQRSRVPWIIVTGHAPMYSSEGVSAELVADIEPLLLTYGVDLHVVGHVHLYESLWPTGPNGTVANASFIAPRAPVHVTSGVGGAPAFGVAKGHEGGGGSAAPAPAYVRQVNSTWSYSRFTAHNSSHLEFEQVDNTGIVFDAWTVVQPAHGPFV